MAEVKRFIPDQQLDISQILQEAKHRWLRPAEICKLISNHTNFQLKPEPPTRPAAGSLFLFDRKALRYYRKDGHRWRKKKDGKTVKEAHEKLKAGSVDVLHCYYAHGEENENFQRRCYWMLEGDLTHIVLVHYREVKEGYKSGISRLLPSPRSQIESPQNSSVPCSTPGNSPAPTVQTSFTTNPNRVDWNGQTLSSEFEDVDSGDNPGASCLSQPAFASISSSSLLSHGVAGVADLSRMPLGSFYPGSKSYNSAGSSSAWAGTHSLTRSHEGMREQKSYVEHPIGAELLNHGLIDSKLDVDFKVNDFITCGDRFVSNTSIQVASIGSKGEVPVQQGSGFNLGNPSYQDYSDPHMVATLYDQVQNSDKDVTHRNDVSAELKKLDSFGRWMDITIGPDCDDSLMATDSGNYWNTLDTENDDKEVSSLSHHIQLDIHSLAPSLSQEQLFSIFDFSPDWAYTGEETKVLVVGRFLSGKKHSAEPKWGCMFGEIEVPAEVVLDNVIRCQAPPHAPGRVPFYVTCSNRLASSEVREFEYREKPQRNAAKSSPEDELRLQIRLGKLLNLGSERKFLKCTIRDCDKCKLASTISSIKVNSDHLTPGNMLIQNLMADRLSQWLASKVHEEGKGPNLLDDEGHGVIHLAASLGYHWAIGPIVAAGVSPNFRDARGRTGLHWASCFGREEAVLALVKSGAAPGAVDDPTSVFPGGQTAADLASSSGHKGIAGFLAEADLKSLLSLLNLNENATECPVAMIAAENATEVEAEVVTSGLGSGADRSLKGSLAAVRKSALAASLIQSAFRSCSFRHRQSHNRGDDTLDDSLNLVALSSFNKVQQKFGHFDDHLHSAAKNIQKKYRGWKGRNEFLDLRKSAVKIQAHVRGHQVRKQYKKLVWSVGILEKVVLRWRRKRAGLRGFRVEKAVEDALPDVKRSDEYEFLHDGRKKKCIAVEKAFSRVKSMVRHSEAREQYMRLVSKVEKLEIDEKGNSASRGEKLEVDEKGNSASRGVDRSEESTAEEALLVLTNN